MRRKTLKKLVLRTRFFQHLTTHPREIFFHLKNNQLIIYVIFTIISLFLNGI